VISDSVKKDIVEHLMPLYPEKVIVFGSYAWGTPSVDSDIDLLIIKKSSTDQVRRLSHEAMGFLRPLIFKYQKGFDVLLDDPVRIEQRVSNLQDQFYAQIMKKGVPIYG